MRRIIGFLIIAFIISGSHFSMAVESSGKITKLLHYYASGNEEMVLQMISEVELDNLPRQMKMQAVKQLEQLGDTYLSRGKPENASIIFKKIADTAPEYWTVFNRIEHLRKIEGKKFYSFKTIFKQTAGLISDPDSALTLTGLALSSFFFGSIFSFFILGLMLFVKYFKLFSNDALNADHENLSLKKLAIFSILLFWPLIFLGGWMIYAFLISGIFWIYLSRRERISILTMVILVLIFSLLFGFKSFLNKSRESENYRIIKELSNGRVFSKRDYSKFDNELKVLLAYNYYENGDYNPALDILLSTGDNFKSTLKSNLMGNIYFKSGNTDQSILHFKDSLDINEKDTIALNNFAIALAMQKNPKIFESYSTRFPEIKTIKVKVHKLMEIDNRENKVLKKRMINFSDETFNFISFFSRVFTEFFKLPGIYYSLLFFIYLLLISKIFPKLGESTQCAKCGKIIKQRAADATSNFCSECYQLFIIKDVIFLEAKVSKEEKIKKKNSVRGIFIGLLSLVFPGINLAFRGKYISFALLSIIFYGLVSFSLAGKAIFVKVFSTYPLIFNFVLMMAAVFYFAVNLYSVSGDQDGI